MPILRKFTLSRVVYKQTTDTMSLPLPNTSGQSNFNLRNRMDIAGSVRRTMRQGSISKHWPSCAVLSSLGRINHRNYQALGHFYNQRAEYADAIKNYRESGRARS